MSGAVQGSAIMAQKRATASSWHGHFEPKRVPEGVWMRCDGCQATLFRKEVEQQPQRMPRVPAPLLHARRRADR